MHPTFSELTEGMRLGRTRLALSAADLALWREVAGDDGSAREFHAPGLIAALMMRGYMRILPRRPPGNIHAHQTWDWLRPVPRTLEALELELHCESKDLRAGRRWVQFGSELRAGDEAYVRSRTRMVWAL